MLLCRNLPVATKDTADRLGDGRHDSSLLNPPEMLLLGLREVPRPDPDVPKGLIGHGWILTESLAEKYFCLGRPDEVPT